VTPSNAYGAFPYVSAGQRRTFRAFLACAADDGVHFVGPLIDSTGNGVFFRLAAGEREAPGTQGRVTADCPQSTVGLFGTPVGPAHARRFERIAKKFAACLREHGFPRHPTPTFGSGDPRTEFWQLPFSWSIPRFVAAVQACVDPLHSYLFST
jgi:hypothetical protein